MVLDEVHSGRGRCTALLAVGRRGSIGEAGYTKRLPHNSSAPRGSPSPGHAMARQGVCGHGVTVRLAFGTGDFLRSSRRATVDHVRARRPRGHALLGRLPLHWPPAVPGLRAAVAGSAAGVRGAGCARRSRQDRRPQHNACVLGNRARHRGGSTAPAAGKVAAPTTGDPALAGAEGRNKTGAAVAHRVATARSVRRTGRPLLYAPAD